MLDNVTSASVIFKSPGASIIYRVNVPFPDSMHPPDNATCNAIYPHSRPITSTTNKLSRLVAVSLILSRVSKVTLIAVSAPIAKSTPFTSLSIVAEISTTGILYLVARTLAFLREPSPPITMRPLILLSLIF